MGCVLLAFPKDKNERALKRAWNNTIARYNIYFNATQRLEKAKKSIAQNHQEDFSKPLHVFQYGSKESAKSAKNYIEELHKKTSKVIQNRPTSKWVDDSYFLIGKGHFFKYDFFSAIETFQFVHTKYQNEKLKDKTQLWIVKSYLQMGQAGNAESILALMLEDEHLLERLDRQTSKEFFATRAQIFLINKNYPFAITYLEKAIDLSKNRVEKYRWHFILGQINLKLNNKSKAKNHFVKVNKLNAPYTYTFQANLGLAKSVANADDPKSIKQGIKYLKRMLKDDKNIDYFDQIYFELAQIEFFAGNDEKAIEFLKLSAKTSTTNNNQKASSFLALGKFYFDAKQYTLAQSYYDSTMIFVDDKHEDFENIKGTHLLLSDLIDNLLNISTKDSLLALSQMSLEDIERIIDEEIERKKEAEAQKLLNQQNAEFQNNLTSNMPQVGNGGTWYFYNNTAVSRGYSEFKRKWGNRKYSDWWRLNTKLAQIIREEKVNKIKAQQTDNKEILSQEQNVILAKIDQNKRKYFLAIPFGPELKKAYQLSIQNSYFIIGKLYQEDLQNYPQAIAKFTTLISKYPNCTREPEALYALYTCYQAEENSIKMNEIHRLLFKRYPESKYNQLIDGTSQNLGESDSINIAYQTLYNLSKKEKYKELINQKKEFDSYLGGNTMQAKFDLLYARAVGAIEGKEAYIKELDFVKNSYPNTQESRAAAYAITILQQPAENAESSKVSLYTFAPEKQHIFASVVKNDADIKAIKIAFNNLNDRAYRSANLSIKSYLFGKEMSNLILVKPFESSQAAMDYFREESIEDIYNRLKITKKTNFLISNENLKQLLKEGDIKIYVDFFTKNYLR